MELRTRPATSWEAENVSVGFLTALQVFGLTPAPTAPLRTPIRLAHLLEAFYAIIAVRTGWLGRRTRRSHPTLLLQAQKLNPLTGALRLHRPKAGQTQPAV